MPRGSCLKRITLLAIIMPSSAKLVMLASIVFGIFIAPSVNAALSLEQAWRLVEHNNPSIDASRATIRAAEGQQIQASLMPNPTLYILQGNVPGFGKYSDNPNSDSTYIINQLIETGGKRNARRNVANAQYQQTLWSYHANNVNLFSQTVQTFLAFAEAEDKLRLSKRGISINQQTINTIIQRINAGKTSELDLHTAKIALSDQKLATSLIESEMISARFSLTKLWNGSEDELQTIIVPALKNMPLAPLSYYLTKTGLNWDLKTLSQAEKVANAELRLANAKKYSDVTVGMGIQHFNQDSTPKSNNAVIAELSIPIPIFDRNQGNIISACENYKKSLVASKSKNLSLQSDITRTYEIASQALLQINTLEKAIVPQSERSLKLARLGYESGRFSYLDLLNAQQRLLDAQMRAVTALYLYRRAWYVLQISIAALPQKENAC